MISSSMEINSPALTAKIVLVTKLSDVTPAGKEAWSTFRILLRITITYAPCWCDAAAVEPCARTTVRVLEVMFGTNVTSIISSSTWTYTPATISAAAVASTTRFVALNKQLDVRTVCLGIVTVLPASAPALVLPARARSTSNEFTPILRTRKISEFNWMYCPRENARDPELDRFRCSYVEDTSCTITLTRRWVTVAPFWCTVFVLRACPRCTRNSFPFTAATSMTSWPTRI